MDASERNRPRTIWFAIAAAAAIGLVAWGAIAFRQTRSISYSEFERLVDAGQVEQVTVHQDLIEGRLKATAQGGVREFSVARVDPQLADRLGARGVVVLGAPAENVLVAALSWGAPLVIFYLIWSIMFRRDLERGGLGGALAVGKSKAKVYAEKDIAVTFADVEGVAEAKFELQEVVAFLRDPTRYGRLGAHVPKGILLVGPPGTGKTLLARAVAGEAGVPFFSISGSEFVEMFVGVGAARVRDLFEQARLAAPCIIFIDELDALGRSRANVAFGGLDEKEQTLNQLLAELDGFDPSVGVILLAATNRPEILDPALLRAGRFDRQVLVDRPDRGGRVAILKVHARKIRMAGDVDLEVVAGLTPGFTGADLANLVNEAAIHATRRDADAVDLDDFTAAIERIVAGIEKKSRVLRPAERRRVAYHEMGHALVAASLEGVDRVQKVSIIPRGVGALGFTMQRPTEDRFLLSVTDLESRLTVLMGGRAAEEIVFDGDVSTGAADDLDRATGIALDMATRYGMAATLGQRTYAPAPETFLTPTAPRAFAASEVTAREIDVATREFIARADARAREILMRRRAELDAGVTLLLARETLNAEDFEPLRRPAKPADAPALSPP